MTTIKILMEDVHTGKKLTKEVPAVKVSKTLWKSKRRGIGVQLIDTMTGRCVRTFKDEQTYLELLPDTMWRYVEWLKTHQAEYTQSAKDFETLVATESMNDEA